MKLSREEQALLETQFPAEIEKQAAAEVNAAVDLYSMGFEKMAAQAADVFDAPVEEEVETEKIAFDEEMEKAAQERAAFIARGYIDGLIKEGSERHGDELHYLYPFIAEKLAVDAKAFTSFMKNMKNKAVGRSKQLASDVKKVVKGTDRHGNKLEAGARAKAALRPAGAAAGLGLAGYGASKMVGGKED